MGAAQQPGGLIAAAEETARRYAEQCLRAHGLPRAPRPIDLAAEHPAAAAARCGLMMLTGDAGGEPELCPAPIAACADGVLAALEAIAPAGVLNGLRGSQLLTERAAITGALRNGAISPNGSCRLLQTCDGMIALNLPREDDWSLLPAWLEDRVEPVWDAVSIRVAARRVETLVERGRLLGLAVADASLRSGTGPLLPQLSPASGGGRGSWLGQAQKRPLVVDLSSLWAGPLCTHLLQLCGAEVIKVESLHRPDGARDGSAVLFDLMHAGKRSVALDFKTDAGRAQLRALLQRADIVVEASRPRALRQLGIDAPALLAARPQQTWISLTGYGRTEPQAQWIAYGDDAGAAAGLSSMLHAATGRWLICGDAIADPLAGLHAALAAWAGWLGGGGGLVELPLADVVHHCAGFELRHTPHERWRAWMQHLSASHQPVLAPRSRIPQAHAAALGADTAAVLSALQIEPAPAC
ncbi:MAG: CoA transferase [Hydrocarboniphaga sp.]|uniref:CoA transferase n=1 Tax=Hydrocarboniphaga sp. TaxID=2033016 RepID=UPI00262D0D0D|nr:CoA transferase [Hydrocarboniphaga sp.]MDB5972526.1 CoA transferase [Hydrocarboniphaga sp.]